VIDNVHDCFYCHSDHHGEAFDPTQAAFAFFDHSKTSFSLAHHQVNYDASPMECKACHPDKDRFTVSQASCAKCHATRDLTFVVQHSQDYGENCTICHDGRDQFVNFDHQTTSFPLTGIHTQILCSGCHSVQKSGGGRPAGFGLTMSLFKGTPRDCAQCHAKDNPHPDMLSDQCGDCHNTGGWFPALYQDTPFDHLAQGGFGLVHHQQTYDGNPLGCNDCHQGKAKDFGSENCINCHSQGVQRAAFMSAHQGKYGQDCTACHDGVDRMHNFDHEKVFALDGKHAEVPCEDCHQDKVFAGTPKTCVECHREPEIHAGFFGVQCELCHTTQAWVPALLHIHNFPLDHGDQGVLDCKICHMSRYTEYTCYGCHDHQPDEIAQTHLEKGIGPVELVECTKCHLAGRTEEN
jgi:hypothetical protein